MAPGKRKGKSKALKRMIKGPWGPKKRTTQQLNKVIIGKGFPKIMQMTHKYTEIVTLACPAGVPYVYNFSTNSIYDPNVTGGGHQPIYSDNMKLLYNTYRVIGSKIKFRFMQTAVNNLPFTCCLLVNEDTTLASNDPVIMSEQTGSTLKFLQPQDAGMTMTKGWSLKKTAGALATDNTYSGTTGTNPVRQNYFTLIVQPTDQVSTQSVIVYADVQYITQWTQVIDVAAS